MKNKLSILFLLVLIALVILLGVITFINLKSGDRYKKQVLSQAQQKYESRTIPSKRGSIYDSNGNLLAVSNKVYNVILDCQAVNSDSDYMDPTVKALVDIFGIDEGDIRTRLTSESTKDSQYQILKKQVSMDDKQAFEDYCDTSAEDLSAKEIEERRNVQGVWFEEDYLRVYPYNETACDTLGFTFSRDTADYGIEGYYNSTLTGTDGRQYGYLNDDSTVEQTIIEAQDGNSLELSLDLGTQQIVEKWVNAFMESTGAKNIGVIVEDPSNGEILAMDGGDRYDLNDPRDLSSLYSQEEIKAMNDEDMMDALTSMWNNFCVTDIFEPGSVVKPIVMAAALEQGKISTTDTFYCDGFQNFGVPGNITTIKCANVDGHGTETLAEVIANSCNDAMMQIGAAMGVDNFLRAQSTFNFGSRTGIDLPNEGYGIMHTKETMKETELACSAFGQGFSCTMIQEINAMCSVINGGYYYQPHLVTKIKDANGGLVKNITPVLQKQTISSNISADIRSYMAASVQQGTSMKSKVQGYSSGGKTGTAEKFPRGNGKYVVSFIGFAPVEDPKVLIYVVVDEPDVEDQASSSYPQFVAQAILSELLPYMNVQPDESTDGTIPTTELWEGFDGHVKNTNYGQIDENGNLVDDQGNRIDWDGNRIDDNGYLLNSDGSYQIDENGEYIKSTNLEGTDIAYGSSGDGLPEGISDTNVPGPPDDNTDPIEDNNMTSEGLTNEEAGLE
ncbi:MAG: penicillin-binding protein 2 [Blautia sp.]